MLQNLLIENVVLIEHLDINFSSGLTVFSGETGAGKSVLLGSLGLILGGRAETSLIRKGAEKFFISACFDVSSNEEIKKLCADAEIDCSSEILIKRSLTLEGKSKISVNDIPVSLHFLKELGTLLVEIHGQFDNLGLLNPSTHIDVLDTYGGYITERQQTAENYKKWHALKMQLQDVLKASQDAQKQEELLKSYQSELEKANVKKGEEETLTEKHNNVIHAEKLVENFNEAYQSLTGENISGLIRHAQSAIARANTLTQNKYTEISEALDTALIQLSEATSLIENANAEINLNAAEAEYTENRLFALKALARKHQCTIEDLPDVLENINKQLLLIDGQADLTADLTKQTALAREEFIKSAEKLHQKRLQAAQKLDYDVTAELKGVKMERAVFQTHFEHLAENSWNAKGTESVCFLVQTNPNTDFGMLNKIASGGELSRFMLALKVNLAEINSAQTLIFDEIDAGIGGATAQAVGERLSKLSQNVQVMVVTHAPQVAAFSDSHFKVSKTSTPEKTTTNVVALNALQKKEEIARMLSGENISDAARGQADVLIAYKQGELNF